MWRRSVRRFMLGTTHTPLGHAYRAGYATLVRGAVIALRRFASVRALYVSRSVATGTLVPGISDIDLIVITGDDSEHAAIRRTFRSLNAISAGLIDYYPALVMTHARFRHRWKTSPLWRIRHEQGRAQWTLLYGADVLADPPSLTRTELTTGCVGEMGRWWASLATYLLSPASDRRDTAFRNALCYKTVSEVLGAYRATRTGEHAYLRSDVLAHATVPLASRLTRLAAGGFLARDPRLETDTARFLIRLFADLWRTGSLLDADPTVTQSVDAPEHERGDPRLTTRYLPALRSHLARGRSGRFGDVRLVRGAAWGLDDVLVVVDVALAALPSAPELTALIAAHQAARPQLPATSLFVRAGNAIMPLTPELPRDFHRGVLTPGTAPDVFLQLGHRDVYWTELVRWMLCDWQTNEQWTNAGADKRDQLAAIAGGARDGHVCYPETRGALNRFRARNRRSAAR